MLSVEHSPSIPMVSKVPTILIGMDVSHGSPGQTSIPSIAAVCSGLQCTLNVFYICCIGSKYIVIFCIPNNQVVSSRQWPLISRYRASVRTQSPKVEMIDSLFKKVSDAEDEGIMRWVLSHCSNTRLDAQGGGMQIFSTVFWRQVKDICSNTTFLLLVELETAYLEILGLLLFLVYYPHGPDCFMFIYNFV